MAQDFSIQILSLREDFSKNPNTTELIRSRCALACSKDNQLILCGSTVIYVIDMVSYKSLEYSLTYFFSLLLVILIVHSLEASLLSDNTYSTIFPINTMVRCKGKSAGHL